MSNELGLACILVIPFACAFLLGLAPRLREVLSLSSAAGLFLLLVRWIPTILAGHQPSLEIVQFFPGLTLTLTLEPLGLLFALLASGLWFVTTLYSIGYLPATKTLHPTRFYRFFALALGSTIGIALAGNLLTLFFFYEALTLLTYPLVVHQGDPNSRKAGRTYLGLLLGSSICLLLPAILWTWQTVGHTDFRLGGIFNGHLQGIEVGLLLALFSFGLGKAALMPMHRWLPAAMVAPAPVSALLHAVAVVKAGVFSLLKIVTYLFGWELLQTEVSSHWLFYVAGFTLVAGSLIALRQDNLKRRLAYSTISQLAYIILATALLTPLSALAAALHIAAHAVAKITLFFAAGALYVGSGKTAISQLAGIGHHMPWTMGAFCIGALSLIGLPPTIGFISKWYLIQAGFQTRAYEVFGLLLLSTLLNAAYFAPIVHTAFFRSGSSAQNVMEAPIAMRLAMILSASLCLLLFFWPDTLLQLATAFTYSQIP